MIYNIYKPPGWTSFDVVKKIRIITKEKKVGHAGTLDPFAEGVLIVGTGIDTKSLSKISNTSKSYIYRIEILTNDKKLFFYEWQVEKGSDVDCKNCWFTSAVSLPTDQGNTI